MKILMVCLGNICRSPAAQGVLESLAQGRSVNVEVDSAGTAAYHIGKAPDSRSISALRTVGIDISAQRARQVSPSDFDRFDWVLAMDKENLKNLQRIAPAKSKAKVAMLGEYREGLAGGEVADPYWDEQDGFVAMREHLTILLTDFLEREVVN